MIIHTRPLFSFLTLSLLSASLLGSGCKKQTQEADPKSTPPPAAKDELGALRASADIVLDELAALESEKDVTCWTSFRQLDWYIAEKSYGEFATLAKVAAGKALVRAAWAKASRKAPGDTITGEDLAKAVTLPEVAIRPAAQEGLPVNTTHTIKQE